MNTKIDLVGQLKRSHNHLYSTELEAVVKHSGVPLICTCFKGKVAASCCIQNESIQRRTCYKGQKMAQLVRFLFFACK